MFSFILSTCTDPLAQISCLLLFSFFYSRILILVIFCFGPQPGVKWTLTEYFQILLSMKEKRRWEERCVEALLLISSRWGHTCRSRCVPSSKSYSSCKHREPREPNRQQRLRMMLPFLSLKYNPHLYTELTVASQGVNMRNSENLGKTEAGLLGWHDKLKGKSPKI